MPNLTLIQLISDQTMPNVLPILRLRPDRVIHLVTPRTAAKSDLVVRAARAAGETPDVETVTLSPMPGIPECFRAVKDLIDTAPPRSVGTRWSSLSMPASGLRTNACFSTANLGPFPWIFTRR